MDTTYKSIPIYQPSFNGNEKTYVVECVESSWISSRGKYVSIFESEFASYLNINCATTVSNGTAALHLALQTIGIGPGDEVIVPTFTYIASVNTIAYVGATPVFVDSEDRSWNIDPDLIVAKISPKTKAVMAVHLYGAACDMNSISSICKEHNLLLIEDAAEAFGTKYRGQYAGSFGDISAFSFFGNKTITTGEGGMVVSNDQTTIDRAAYLKSHAASSTREYWHDEIGFNFRMTNMCAAIGVAQLEHADKILLKKRELAAWYRADLADTSLVFQADSEDALNSYWMVSILAKDISERDTIRQNLKAHSIETRPLFHPAHTMPAFKTEDAYPIAELLSSRGLNLPSYPDLTREQVAYVSSKIIEAINK
jgi:perosamine synthetase